VVAAGAVAAGVILLSGGSSTNKSSATDTTTVAGEKIAGNLGPVPTNRVTGDGNVDVRLNKNVATVSLNTTGLLDASHPLHIHAGGKGICPPASAARDHHGHSAISTLDGVPYYGPPVTALTTNGRTDVKSILALPRFPRDGAIRYRRTFRLTKAVAAYVREGNGVIVVHGSDYNHNGIYDNGLDRSDLDRKLPGELTTPALCGPLVPAAGAQGPSGNSSTARAPGRLYTASLRSPAAPSPAWLCPLHDLPEADRAIT
jgi:hypothetical protein